MPNVYFATALRLLAQEGHRLRAGGVRAVHLPLAVPAQELQQGPRRATRRGRGPFWL